MSFGSPNLLVALVAVPLAIVAYWIFERRRVRRSERWSRAALLPNMARRPAPWLRHVSAVVFLLGLVALLLGFARPQRSIVDNRANAPTVAVVLDVSGSMASDDVGSSRIGAARQVAKGLLHELPARYRAAVLTFGNKAHVAQAPTLDHAAAIARLPAGIVPKAGTSLGDAIAAGVAVVESASSGEVNRSRYTGAVVVLSDGAQTAGGTNPDDAADAAVLEGIPIDTVAIGTRTGTVTQRMTVDGFDTSVQYKVPVDAAALETVSQLTHGSSFELGRKTDEPSIVAALASAYSQLGSSSQRVSREQSLSRLFAIGAVILIAGGVMMSMRLYGRPA